MYQINPQFITHYLVPLTEEILRDAKKQNNEAVYLQKLFVNQALTAQEAAQFKNRYFYSKQGAKLPFTGTTPEDQEFQDFFITELGNQLTLRNRLSGNGGAMRAYGPESDNSFSNESQKNLQRLGYTIIQQLEKKKIEEVMTGKQTAEKLARGQTQQGASGLSLQTLEKKHLQEKRQLQNGQLKLIEVNGEPTYLSEQEAKRYAGNPNYSKVQVTPFYSSEGKSIDPAINPKSETFGEMEHEFKEPKIASVREMLEEGGFEAINDLDTNEKGDIVGKVRDENGKEYELKVTMGNGEEDLNFELKPISLTSNSEGKPLVISGKELQQRRFLPRAKTNIDPIKHVEETKYDQSKRPHIRLATVKTQVHETQEIEMTPIKTFTRSKVIPKSNVIQSKLAALAKIRTPFDSDSHQKASVLHKKITEKEMMEKARQNQHRSIMNPPEAPGRIRSLTSAQKPEKKKINPMIIAGGSAGGAVGLATAAAATGAFLGTHTATKAISFLAHCIGICFA